MKTITLTLEDDEIMILRAQARLLAIMGSDMSGEEGGENIIGGMSEKILKATLDLPEEYKKEIGKMQRAMRVIKQTPSYGMFIQACHMLNKALADEINKQNPDL